jgi:hypothetical protein
VAVAVLLLLEAMLLQVLQVMAVLVQALQLPERKSFMRGVVLAAPKVELTAQAELVAAAMLV